MVTDKQLQFWIKASKVEQNKNKQYTWHRLDHINQWFRISTKRNTGVFMYRITVDNKNTWYTIGEYPAVTLHQANNKAIELRNMIKIGVNPTQQKKDDIKSRTTIGYVIDLMIDGLINKGATRTSKVVLNTFKNRMAILNDVAIVDLTPNLIRTKVINPLIADNKLNSAHTVLQRAKQLATFAYDRELTKTNTLEKLKNDFFTPQQRDRVLDNEEIAKLLTWCNNANQSDCVVKHLQLCLMLGTRLQELLTLKWDNVNINNQTILLTETKNKNDLLIKLPPQALNIFKSLMHHKIGEYVFSNGKKHFTYMAVQTRINNLIKDTNIAKFSCHDLRRTFSSKLAELGYNLDLIDCATNHVLQGIRKNYVHTIRLEERYKMLCDWADFLDEVKNGK